ncbi:MAG: glycosyltransferase [Dehalococcoidia bacterium]|nr:glycosyltransferase [Dehalococcoidia bacterium]
MSRDPGFRVAMLCLHSCPLDVPGTRDSGGMNVYVEQLAKNLGKLGIHVDIFTRRHQPAVPHFDDFMRDITSKQRFTPARRPKQNGEGCNGRFNHGIIKLGEGVRLIHLPVEHDGGKLELYNYLPDFYSAICHFAEKEETAYRIVHSHYWLSGAVGQMLAGRWQVPHVVMFHTSARAKNRYLDNSTEPQLRADMEEQILSSADLVVASTGREKADLMELYGTEAEKIRVIPCGVDMKLFRPRDRLQARKVLGLNGIPIILYVGRIENGKGIELLIDSLPLMSSHERSQLLLVGGGASNEKEIESIYMQSKRLGVDGRVSFCGTVNQKQLPLYYAAADVCVLPSQYETFGMVPLEALACGTPVIAPKVGAMEDIIQPDINGLLLGERSPSQLADALSILLGSKTSRQSLSSFCRSTAGEFNWPVIAGKMAGEYFTLIENV